MHRSRGTGGVYYPGNPLGGPYGASSLYGTKPIKAKDERTISVTFGRSDSEKHCAGIQALQMYNGALFTASRDGTIKRWGIKEDYQPILEGSYEGHSDWVNAIAIVDNYLASASSDGSVKLWDPARKASFVSIACHQDYASCLASAPGQSIFASAGLRSEIFLHTIEVNVTSTRQLFPSSTSKDKGSIYSLAMDRQAKMIAAGSTEAVIRLFDLRTASKTMKLKGHTENVRCLALNADGTKLLSGSSDHSMKLWDLGHQRCIQTFHVHSDSVWCLLPSENFNVVISGGRDKCIFKTRLAQRTSELLFVEDEPINDMVRTASDTALWVATASSSVKKWSLPAKHSGEYNTWSAHETSNHAVPGRAFLIAGSSSRRSIEPMRNLKPIAEPPATVIEGIPAIVEHAVLNNQFKILTKDRSGEVALWDVTTGCEIESFGQIDFQEKLYELHEFVSTPRWFTAEKKLGQLTLVLKYPQCFAAEFYANDFALDTAEDKKLNYAQCMLKGLLGQWVLESGPSTFDEADPVDVCGTGWVDIKKNKVPAFRFWDDPRARVFLSGASKSNEAWRMPVSEISGVFNEHGELPDWVVDCVLKGKLPVLKDWKFSFYLDPADESVPPLSQNRLNAPKILQIRKVAIYLKQKLLDLDPPFPINVISYEMETSESHRDSEETCSMPEDMDIDLPEIELMCKGYSVPCLMSIGAVHEYVWKESKELIITYRVRTSTLAPAAILTQAKQND